MTLVSTLIEKDNVYEAEIFCRINPRIAIETNKQSKIQTTSDTFKEERHARLDLECGRFVNIHKEISLNCPFIISGLSAMLET